jgi:uracil-DNA glycosylase family 4
MLVVGLAPGLHGAHRTGRAFVGDSSGSFLFAALAATGFASAVDPAKARLQNLLITNAVKCLPPQNQVKAAELHQCASYLAQELKQFWQPTMRRPRVLLALGQVAYQACLRLLEAQGLDIRQAGQIPKFGHGVHLQVAPSLHLLSSFHPSRQNVNTKRLDQPGMQRVLNEAKRIIMAP